MATGPADVGTKEKDEPKWSGVKLAILGVIAMLIAVFILYSISPYDGIILPEV